jgi:nicotinate-nucleotide--dimethylbenzimidazole phosphoribosyltransferase
VKLNPAVKDYLFAAHGSVEPGHRHLLALIGQRPLLDLQMRLGEGTGAALAMQLMQGGAAAFQQMATFASSGVADADQPVVQA